MTTNNNSAAVNSNNNNNTEATSMSTYTVKIADRTGHTEMAELTLEQATDNILASAENNARWVFINGEKFEFEGTNYRAETNLNNLKTKLQAITNPEIVLTGVLVGGYTLGYGDVFEGYSEVYREEVLVDGAGV